MKSINEVCFQCNCSSQPINTINMKKSSRPTICLNVTKVQCMKVIIQFRYRDYFGILSYKVCDRFLNVSSQLIA